MNWTQQKLMALPTKDGFYLRGNEMSRIETFVAAAFAFLLTMVMVAGNDIPNSVTEFRIAVLYVPAFVVCALQIIWIWYRHAVWSRRYGLEDAWTVCLSGILIVTVLVYVYPLKAMASGFFNWVSVGYFPSKMQADSIDDIRFLFYFFSSGFFTLSFTLWGMHKLVLIQAKSLALTKWESYQTKTECLAWLIMCATSLVSILLAKFLDGNSLAFAGLIYASFGISLTLLHVLRAKHAREIDQQEKCAN